MHAGWQNVRYRFGIAAAFGRHFYRHCRDDGCHLSAAALTYMTLFAVVPLLTLSFAAFSLVPALGRGGERLQGLILEWLLPLGNPEIGARLVEFATRARSLSAAGGLILVFTALLTLRAIERTFNRIWDVANDRRGRTGWLRYWAVLTLGPVLMGVALLMHTYLLALPGLAAPLDALGLGRLTLDYLPWLLTWVAFSLLYIAVPNAPIRLCHGMIAGLVATLVFQLAKSAFAALVSNSDYRTVYGAFAAFPLLLIWIHLGWLIVLGGAELVRSLETFRRHGSNDGPSDLCALVMACLLCARAQRRGGSVSDRDLIAAGVPGRQWQRLRDRLREHQILARTAAGTYVLARHPGELHLAELVALAPAELLAPISTQPPEAWRDGAEWERFATALRDARATVGQTLRMTLEELADG